MAESVLVTGGSGFIARWCVTALIERGFDVRTTVRDPAFTSGYVADLTRDEVSAVSQDALLAELFAPAAETPLPVPVVDARGKLVGVIPRVTLLEAMKPAVVEPDPLVLLETEAVA